MDPKQTSPLGSTPVGGQEGQTIPPASSVGGDSGATNATNTAGTGAATSASPAPVFSTGTSLGSSSSGASGISSANIGASTSSGAKMDGMLGAANLSTGANVSRTMSSLNSRNQSATGRSLFSRHKFDRAEPDGSIVLASDPNDANRKTTGEPLERRKMIRNIGIIGGILAVVLIVGIVLAFAMAPKKEDTKNSGNNSSVLASVVSNSFNEYANYILYGEASVNPVEELNISNQYAINKMLYQENEESISFFDEAKTYFDSFDDTYNRSELNAQSDYLSWFLPYYRKVFYFIYNYSQADGLSVDKLLPIFLESGDKGLDAYFEANYSVFRDIELDNSQEYYDYQQQILDFRKKYLNLAEQNGCIKNGSIIENCKVAVGGDEITKYGNASNMSANRIGLSVDELIGGISRIQAEIAEPGAQQDDEVVNENGVRPDDIVIEVVENNEEENESNE